MGNFSRPPETRLADALGKHYVGNRVQQGVPLLDADLHLLEGLHRTELESVGRWVLGSGVPVGSDAFRVLALAGGGVGTVVLRAGTSGTGPSSLEIDLVASAAAAALGFEPGNASASRVGDWPAQLTGDKAGPFALTSGATLVITVDGGAPATVTFQSGDFTNIAAATAAEVVAAINAAAAGVTASVGAGNDFWLTGGDGTLSGAGRILVEGRMALIERGLRYTEQPLFRNAALAELWSVDPIGPIPTPTVNTVQLAFLDVWHREVRGDEDHDLVDSRIGIETATALRREWAVRVTAAPNYPAALAAKPAGHAYYPLAELHRGANNPGIAATMIVDVRDTDASLRPEIAYRNAAGVVLVNTQRFRNMLAVTRDGARGFITYLTTQFVTPPSTPLTVAEILGIEALSEIAAVADHALTVVQAQALGTRGALGVMLQLYDAEERFVTVWQSTVLPLVKGGSQVYNAAFASSIALIKAYLDGPAPGGNVAVAASVPAANLDGAVTSQERIAAELASQAGKPLGVLSLKYLGSIAPTVTRNTPLDLKYEVSGSVTPDDDLDVLVSIDPQWSVGFKNGDGSTPFALRGGPGTFVRQFFVTVTPPDVAAGQTLYSLEVYARKNPGGLSFFTTQKRLQIGQAPPPSEEQYQVKLKMSSEPVSGGVVQVPRGTTAHITFSVVNNTTAPIVFDWDPSTSGVWQITPGMLSLTNNTVNPNSESPIPFQWDFKAPGTGGNVLTFTLIAEDHANPATILAEVTISLIST